MIAHVVFKTNLVPKRIVITNHYKAAEFSGIKMSYNSVCRQSDTYFLLTWSKSTSVWFYEISLFLLYVQGYLGELIFSAYYACYGYWNGITVVFVCQIKLPTVFYAPSPNHPHPILVFTTPSVITQPQIYRLSFLMKAYCIYVIWNCTHKRTTHSLTTLEVQTLLRDCLYSTKVSSKVY